MSHWLSLNLLQPPPMTGWLQSYTEGSLLPLLKYDKLMMGLGRRCDVGWKEQCWLPLLLLIFFFKWFRKTVWLCPLWFSPTTSSVVSLRSGDHVREFLLTSVRSYWFCFCGLIYILLKGYVMIFFFSLHLCYCNTYMLNLWKVGLVLKSRKWRA